MRVPRVIVFICALVLAIIATGLVASNVTQSSTLREQSGIISTLSANNDALREQVKAQGQVPVAPPAHDVVGEKGDPGNSGPQGVPGRPPTSEEISTAVRAYCSVFNGCMGPQGSAGSNGANGADGAPGPAGPAGADGAPGQPPASWTFTDRLGMQHSCTRTDPFDPAAPTYTCS